MALKGKKPEAIEKRLKVLFYGSAGVGKTMAAISFPNVYLIDTERGSENDEYVTIMKKNGGAVFQTTDFDDLITEVRSLSTEKHEFKTLVIDPMTTLYNDLLDKEALKVGTEFGRHYSSANKRMKHLINLLMKLDLNVILTAHLKNEYGQNLSIIGTTFDCFKKLDHMFDLSIEVQRRGKDRVGIIKKSRIKSFPDSETIPFSYEEISKRYGKELLEKNAIPQELAEKAQVNELLRLIELIKVPHEISQKWLDKAQSETWEEMTKESIQKCIDHLGSKIKGEE